MNDHFFLHSLPEGRKAYPVLPALCEHVRLSIQCGIGQCGDGSGLCITFLIACLSYLKIIIHHEIIAQITRLLVLV